MKVKRLLGWCAPTLLALSLAGCCNILNRDKKEEAEVQSGDDLPTPKNGFVIDSGFRPSKNGFSFENGGNANFPRTPGFLSNNSMIRLFGAKNVCVNGNTKNCKATPPAAEFMKKVNRSMNMGQCEGMAVASLTMFKNIDKPAVFAPGAAFANVLKRDQVRDLIGYYFAYQFTNPVITEKMLARRDFTPSQTLDRIVKLIQAGDPGVVSIRAPDGRSGHAVSPYAVQDKGNGIYWVRIYDNNWPGKERYIEVDKKANTWRYDLAALNAGASKMPWSGNAESRSFGVTPISARLKPAICPFCKTSNKSRVVWGDSTRLTMTDQEGRKIGYDDNGKLVNDIPGADMIELESYVEGAAAPEPIYVLPAENSYDISMEGSTAKEGDDEDEVAIFGEGTAITVESMKLAPKERTTMSLSADGGEIKFRAGSNRVPRMRMAVDDDKSGYTVQISNLRADKDDEVEVKLDRRSRGVTVQGGGKTTEGYDLKLTRVRDDADDEENEHKGIKFRGGESHRIELDSVRGKDTPPRIARGVYVRKPRVVDKDKDKDEKDTPNGRRGVIDRDKDAKDTPVGRPALGAGAGTGAAPPGTGRTVLTPPKATAKPTAAPPGPMRAPNKR